MKKYLLSLSLILILTSCASTVKTNITNQERALAIHDKIVFLDIKYNVPKSAKKLGV